MGQAVGMKWMSLPPAPPALVHLSIHHTYVRSDHGSEMIQLFVKRKHSWLYCSFSMPNAETSNLGVQ